MDNQPQGGQCEILSSQVGKIKLTMGLYTGETMEANTNIGNGIVEFVQTAVVGSGVISRYQQMLEEMLVTITFTRLA